MIQLAAVLLAVLATTTTDEPVDPKIIEAVSGLSPVIAAADLQSDVAFLAADACGGRLTGSEGARRAGQYIARVFQNAGLQPPDAMSGYYQPFEFTAGVRQVAGQIGMEIVTSTAEGGAVPCRLDADFRPLAFSGNGRAEGQVVFAGYGLVTPDASGGGYDSYAGLDVTGKVVLALEGLPEEAPPQRRQELGLYAGDRYKAKLAEQRGASAFLLVRGPNSLDGGKLVGFNQTDRTADVPIVAASVSGELAGRLLGASAVDLKTLQTALDGGTLPPPAPTASGPVVRLNIELERLHGSCRNVLGVLPPAGGSDQYVVVGAHYDHIGTGEGLGSLARAGEQGAIHNGADDNASGTAVILELAAAFAEARRAAAQPQRGILFACWSGEELGLVGSSHFVTHPAVPPDRMVAYLNFDMVGRLRNDKLILQAVGSSPAWRRLVERRNVPAGFNLILQDDPYLPTDATAFYTRGVPVLSFFTDLHDDYNRPTDDPQTLNYEGMERIARFARQLVEDLTQVGMDVAYERVERSAPAGERMARRVYTGTIPDFAAEGVEGVRLADVRPGGPAAQAGLRGGDVIVEFAGQRIASLQDYSDALVAAKVGQTVPIVVLRDGVRVALSITPASRPD